MSTSPYNTAKFGALPLRLLLFLFWINAFLYARYCPLLLWFRIKVGYFPNIARPLLYHEKMFWRKVFDHNPQFIIFSDKLACKNHVQQTLPSLAIPKTLWTEHTIDGAVRRPQLENTVIKANHGCGFNYFPKDSDTHQSDLRKLVRSWLNTNYGWKGLEWSYLHVKKTIFAEELIIPSHPHGLIDINVRATDGKVILCSVITDNKTDNMRYAYFVPDGTRLDSAYHQTTMGLAADFILPEVFFEAVRLTESLSKGVDYARYDFMTDGEMLYGGEITVYPSGGISRAQPLLDEYINQHWNIRKSWFLTTKQSSWKAHYARILQATL